MKSANLPRPDDRGNYWLGTKGHGPAILPVWNRSGFGCREFIASLDERGFLFEGRTLKRFKSVTEAFRAIQGK